MATKTRKRAAALSAAVMASALLLAACGETEAGEQANEAGGPEVDEEWADCTPGEGSEDLTGQDPDDEDTDVSVVEINGWDDTVVPARLMKYALEEEGYSVTVDAFEPAAAYTGVAEGDRDILASMMLPVTHADYIDQYGDSLDSLGCWFNEARNVIAVNEDSPAQTLSDLAEMGDEYGNQIVGIEPGAGLMRITESEVMPTYGLDDWELTESSTPAMLGAVQSAVSDGENIAVTMWHPHWAYESFPLRDLEDPEGAFGEDEVFVAFSREGFADESPYATQLVQNFALTNEDMTEIQFLMNSEDHYAGEDADGAVAEWAEENEDFFERWKAGTLIEDFQ